MTSAGLGFYALTLYLRTLTEERGFSVSSVSGATALFFETEGDPEKLGPMVEEMMANVVACLDLERLRSTTMSEYLVTSL